MCAQSTGTVCAESCWLGAALTVWLTPGFEVVKKNMATNNAMTTGKANLALRFTISLLIGPTRSFYVPRRARPVGLRSGFEGRGASVCFAAMSETPEPAGTAVNRGPSHEFTKLHLTLWQKIVWKFSKFFVIMVVCIRLQSLHSWPRIVIC